MKLNFKNFNSYLKNNFIFEKRPSIALGLSGGPDSMALLFLLLEWKKKVNCNIIALIVNHNLRHEFKNEILPILKFLNKKKINYKILSVRKSSVIKKSMNEARLNRYNLLTNFCKKNNILHLFVAHHKEDNLETFVYRKLAGSDLNGLSAINNISLINKTVILRPLLNFSKKSIINYNKRNNIIYLDDPSNLDLKYARPTIRNFLNETNKKELLNIENEYLYLNKYSKLYKLMISQILIKVIHHIKRNEVKLNLEYFLNYNVLILIKITEKIYQFLNNKNKHLRSKKIELFIKNAKDNNFKQFYLRDMLIKKVNDSLVFSKKAS